MWYNYKNSNSMFITSKDIICCLKSKFDMAEAIPLTIGHDKMGDLC